MAERRSVDELTADLIQTPSEPTDGPALEVVESDVIDEVIEDAEEDFIPPEGVEVETGHEEVQDEEEEEIPLEGETDEEQEEAHDESDDGAEYLDITDDDLLEVKVDGEVVYRTVEDAKRALSGEGAIEKRLKEATEMRKSAQSEYDRGVQELEQRRMQIIDTVSKLDEFLFQPTVPVPDEQLRLQDANAYLRHMDAYQADQARIQAGRNQLRQNLAAQQEERDQFLTAQRQRTEQQLMETIPALKDPNTQQKTMENILNVGRSYGFNDQEIAQFFDARAFKMAYDLMALQGSEKRVNTKKVKEESKKRAPRRLRSGVAQKMAKARTSKKAQEQVTERARSTGKVDDVTRMILSKPGRPRR